MAKAKELTKEKEQALEAPKQAPHAAQDEMHDGVQDEMQDEAQEKQTRQARPADPWNQTREVLLPRGLVGEPKSLYFSVGGRGFNIPRGRVVAVPLPIAERVDIYLEAENRERAMKETESETVQIADMR